MCKKWFNGFWKRIEKYQNYLIWGSVILVLLIGLFLKSSNIILFITALIIFYYTLETYRMRKAMSENTEISTRPILILHIDLDLSDTKAHISIENFGNFPAYNVCFEQAKLEAKKSSFDIESKSFRFSFENVDVVPPKGKVEVAFEGEISDNSLFGLLHHQRSSRLPYFLEQLQCMKIFWGVYGRAI